MLSRLDRFLFRFAREIMVICASVWTIGQTAFLIWTGAPTAIFGIMLGLVIVWLGATV